MEAYLFVLWRENGTTCTGRKVLALVLNFKSSDLFFLRFFFPIVCLCFTGIMAMIHWVLQCFVSKSLILNNYRVARNWHRCRYSANGLCLHEGLIEPLSQPHFPFTRHILLLSASELQCRLQHNWAVWRPVMFLLYFWKSVLFFILQDIIPSHLSFTSFLKAAILIWGGIVRNSSTFCISYSYLISFECAQLQ